MKHAGLLLCFLGTSSSFDGSGALLFTGILAVLDEECTTIFGAHNSPFVRLCHRIATSCLCWPGGQ